MKEKLKISCIQMDVQFCRPDENFRKAESLITEAMNEEPDIIVLPEMWNTGFFPRENLAELSDRNGADTKRIIGALAGKYGVGIIAGSTANIKDGKIFNTSYVFSQTGECAAEYDKTHLFSPMEEDKYFEKGGSLCRFSLMGLSCAVIICYDLRFPELTRSLAVNGLDLLFIVSQWPAERLSNLETLVRARAIENQIFAVCCNSCGTAEETVFGGGSMIVSPRGDVLCRAGSSEEIISAECDIAEIKAIREKINVFSDRRPELYKL